MIVFLLILMLLSQALNLIFLYLISGQIEGLKTCTVKQNVICGITQNRGSYDKF
jgi:hypothetical protein